MQFKVYRKSAPKMSPLVSDPTKDNSRNNLRDTLDITRTFYTGKAISFISGGNIVTVSTEDISYVEVVNPPDWLVQEYLES